MEDVFIDNELAVFINKNLRNIPTIQSKQVLCMNVSQNQIVKLSTFPITLRHLIASGNPLKYLSFSSSYENLTKLDVSECFLKSIPSTIRCLPNLESLDAHANDISFLAPELFSLSRLTRLVLHRNQLMNIPSDIGRLTNLDYLALHANRIRVLPPELGNLTKLQRASFHMNAIEHIPPELSQLNQLLVISLFKNKIKLIPEGMLPKWSKCTLLALHENKIEHLPHDILQMPSLEKLWINNNCIIQYPSTLKSMSTLKEVFYWDDIHQTRDKCIGYIQECDDLIK